MGWVFEARTFFFYPQVHKYIYVYLSMSLNTNINVHTHMFVRIYMCARVFIDNIYTYIYIYVYINTHPCVCIYIWKKASNRSVAENLKKKREGCNTRTSQGVTHPSTTLAQARLTSEF